MTIFSQLKDVIETKSGRLLDDFDTFQDFQPYLICRWISMHNPQFAILLNDTTNHLYKGLVSKEQWYQLLISIIPKDKYRYIKYIKKSKKEKNQDESIIQQLAVTLQTSQREVCQFLEHEQTNIKEIRKMFK
jgi:hypothetical protein